MAGFSVNSGRKLVAARTVAQVDVEGGLDHRGERRVGDHVVLVGSAFNFVRDVVVLITRSNRTKRQSLRPVVPERLLYPFHVFDFVGTCVGSRTDGTVIFDSEVDARDGVFAWDNSNLVRGFILEARRRGVEYDHVVFLPHQMFYVVLLLLLILNRDLTQHDVVLSLGDHCLDVIVVDSIVNLLAPLQIAWLLRCSESC